MSAADSTLNVIADRPQTGSIPAVNSVGPYLGNVRSLARFGIEFVPFPAAAEFDRFLASVDSFVDPFVAAADQDRIAATCLMTVAGHRIVGMRDLVVRMLTAAVVVVEAARSVSRNRHRYLSTMNRKLMLTC